MAGGEIEIRCDLKLGMGEASVLTTDLSHAYIDENRRTS
jgi:N-acetylglutamate synthase/N-acetylornithine aminotransferase